MILHVIASHDCHVTLIFNVCCVTPQVCVCECSVCLMSCVWCGVQLCVVPSLYNGPFQMHVCMIECPSVCMCVHLKPNSLPLCLSNYFPMLINRHHLYCWNILVVFPHTEWCPLYASEASNGTNTSGPCQYRQPHSCLVVTRSFHSLEAESLQGITRIWVSNHCTHWCICKYTNACICKGTNQAPHSVCMWV